LNQAFPDITEETAARVYLRPLGILSGAETKRAGRQADGHPLAGGEALFDRCELIVRQGGRIASVVATLGEIGDWAAARGGAVRDRIDRLVDNLARRRPPFAGLSLDKPVIMGIVNVTPDSFSDGGDFADAGDAIAHGEALAAAGSDILDVGGESTRPNATPVAEADELARVLPVIRGLAKGDTPISIDSRKPGVMAAALRAGAAVINDITALEFDAESLEVARRSGAPVILMHSQGDPQTMQLAPSYADAPLDIFDYLEARAEACEAAGIGRARIAVDPGIGFGKTAAHNIEILASLALYHGLGCAIVLGVSRKGFVGRIAGARDPKDRLAGSLAGALMALDQGVQILRVHDVAETVQAVNVWRALRSPRPPGV
jgi:dihydropteroate synthase